MKQIILPFLLLLSIIATAQTDQTITYRNTADGFSFVYPSQWDSSMFSVAKEKFKMDFGAVIKSGFNKIKTGGYVTFKKTEAYIKDLTSMGVGSESALKRVYPGAVVVESKNKISKNKIPYHSLVTEINEFGQVRATNQVQILKDNSVYTFTFTIQRSEYEKLKPYFEMVINSFIFQR